MFFYEVVAVWNTPYTNSNVQASALLIGQFGRLPSISDPLAPLKL